MPPRHARGNSKSREAKRLTSGQNTTANSGSAQNLVGYGFGRKSSNHVGVALKMNESEALHGAPKRNLKPFLSHRSNNFKEVI